jgi:hypothetical protein
MFAKLARIAAYGTGKAQHLALALDRLDKGLAPPAQADDRGIDHRRAGDR